MQYGKCCGIFVFLILQEIACENVWKGQNFTRKFTYVDFYLSLLRNRKIASNMQNKETDLWNYFDDMRFL